ncbi:phenylalanine--tRNA ligase subunit beta [candidate division KSB1 bacterium]|nr:phenylalanine--tRNA ligase subunit beta [candidate division KSB1 bacterium]
MKISLEWISQYVDISDLEPDTIANNLTMATAEVEGVEILTRTIQGIVVGEVVAVEKISKDKNLSLAEVECGGKRYMTVCGAPNVRIGMKSAFAPPGVTIAGDLKIEKSRIAGHISEGILCSSRELGMSEFHDIILEIPAAVKTGTLLSEIMPEKDAIVEIDNKSLTHRPDLWGHYGFAREIAAIFGRELKPLDLDDLTAYQSLPEYPLEIQDYAGCPCYCCMEMKLAVRPSPLPIQWRLHALGQRTFNLLVDLTNYIMLELAQPMHAFDGDKLKAVKVGPFGKEGTFTTLDDQPRKMQSKDLMIWNEKEPVALAGIMGGVNSEVSESTSKLLLESANFLGSRIRRTSVRLGLRTDASQRFEKDQPPINTKVAIQRFISLVKQSGADHEILSRLTIDGDLKDDFRPVNVSVDFLNARVGMQIPKSEMFRILKSLGFTAEDKDDKTITAGIPPFRSAKDISIPYDILEEICRVYGFDNIEPQLPQQYTEAVHVNVKLRNEHKARRTLALGHGFMEVHTYSWFDDYWLQMLRFDPGKTLVLENPSAGNMSRMRTTLLPNMLNLVRQNNLHRDEFRLFEMGRVYQPTEDDKCDETTRLCGISYRQTKSYNLELHFRELRGILEDLALATSAGDLSLSPLEETKDKSTIAGHQAKIMINKNKVGFIGIPENRILKELAPNAQVIWFEIEFDKFFGPIYPAIKYERSSEFPGSWMDFSIVWDTDAGYDKLIEKIDKFSHPLIVKREFVALYKGKPLPQGKGSYSFRYLIGLKERTITGEEIEEFKKQYLEFLKSQELELR